MKHHVAHSIVEQQIERGTVGEFSINRETHRFKICAVDMQRRAIAEHNVAQIAAVQMNGARDEERVWNWWVIGWIIWHVRLCEHTAIKLAAIDVDRAERRIQANAAHRILKPRGRIRVAADERASIDVGREISQLQSITSGSG